jgi:hypothetical protein
MTMETRSRVRLAIVLACMGSLLDPGALWARSEAEIRQDIQAALSQRTPGESPEWWRALGPDAPPVIIRMYGESRNAYHQTRLLEGLSWFDQDRSAVEFLKTQARLSSNDVIRNAAITSLGISQGAREESFIADFLKDADPQTRLAAAQALARMRTPSAEARLKTYLEEEKTPWIRQKLLSSPRPRASGLGERVIAPQAPEAPADWAGVWKGYELVSDAQGVHPVAARLELALPTDARKLSGRLELRVRGKKAVAYSAQVSAPELRHAAGTLAQPGKPPIAFSVERLAGRPGETPLVKIEIPSIPAILLLRRQDGLR